METLNDAAPTKSPRGWMFWTGWVLTAIIILWMGVLGIVLAVTKPEMMKEMTKYGYPESAVWRIFIVELICVILYAIPRTAVLGAILLTGYLGGAVSTHVRAGEPWFFPVIFGIVLWLGIYFRDARLRQLVPLRNPA